MALARLGEAKHPEPEGCNVMAVNENDEASFTFLLHGTAEAHAIGGCDASAIAVAEVVALTAAKGQIS